MLKVLTLFSGAVGGWDIGLERAGYDVIAACEIDPWRRNAYARNFPGVRLYDDVRTLTAARLRSDGVVPDIIVGSPPCTDASAANTRGRGVEGERTGLYREWLRLVHELRPVWTCAENSPRLRTRGVDRLLGELESLGYAVWPLVVSAGDIGAPHERERVWIVGVDADRNRQHGRSVDGEMGRILELSDLDAARLGRLGGRSPEATGRSRAEPPGDGERHHVVDADCPRHAFRQGEPGDACAELPAALRAWAGGWPHWNGGLAGLEAAYAAERAGQLADGAAARLARPGLSDFAAERFAASERNRRIAAGGDAIVPQIAYAIGCAMRRVLAESAA